MFEKGKVLAKVIDLEVNEIFYQLAELESSKTFTGKQSDFALACSL